MNISIPQVLENTIYFLALINPPSKILFLSSRGPPYLAKELFAISMKSSFVAWLILLLLTVGGNFILFTIFHVEIYSLSVAGGIILFTIGLNAVRKGNFYERRDYRTIVDVSIVPLAAPLIAGPGVMTAAIFFAMMNGVTVTLICITLAIILNLLLMLTSTRIGLFLERVHATGPLIRITGLIVTAVAMQMVFNGLAIWVHKTM